MENENKEIKLWFYVNDDKKIFKEETERFRNLIGEENIIESHYSGTVASIVFPSALTGGQNIVENTIIPFVIIRYRENKIITLTEIRPGVASGI